MPRVAITTGAGDGLECLVRKLGIADTEFTTDSGNGHVHLYLGNGGDQFSSGGAFSNATKLWSNSSKLDDYDVAGFSCEGAQNGGTKPQGSMDAVKAYADAGGRLLLGHYHNVWLAGPYTTSGIQKPADWPLLATWTVSGADKNFTSLVDETLNPKGSAFATWMVNVVGSTTRGQVTVSQTAKTCLSVDEGKVIPWLATEGANAAVQEFEFTTPIDQPAASRKGRVMFWDVHAADRAPGNGVGFPAYCTTTILTPQEKAMAFAFFNASSCVGPS